MLFQGLTEKNNWGVGIFSKTTAGEILDYPSNRLRTFRLKVNINLLFCCLPLQY